jgi:hypothetical protein
MQLVVQKDLNFSFITDISFFCSVISKCAAQKNSEAVA